MTLGAHIQALRKERGLSQEALGESLGVSRQAVSQWEADASLPELEKLIAMSRLFSVSLGWLLQVEDSPKAEGDAPPPAETGAMEALLTRYLEEAQRPRRPRRRWPLILAGTAGLLLCANLFLRISDLDQRTQRIQEEVSRVSSTLTRQLGGLTWQVTDILERQNRVTAASACNLEVQDLAAGTATFSLGALPRETRAGMTAQFSAAGTGFDTVAAEGVLGPDGSFTAQLTCPMADEITLSVTFSADGTDQNQVLDTFHSLLTDSRPDLSGHAGLFGDDVVPGAAFLWDRPIFLRTRAVSVKDATGAHAVSVEAVSLAVYHNQLPVWGPQAVDMALVDTEGQPEGTAYSGVPMNLQLDLELGDEVLLVARVTDSLGRSWRTLLDCYTVEAEEGGAYLTPMNYPDITALPEL